MKINLPTMICILLMLYGCNKNNAPDEQLEINPKSTVVNAAIQENAVAPSKVNNEKLSDINSTKNSDNKNDLFVFSGDMVSSSSIPDQYVKIGENLPVSALKKRFPGYKVHSSAGEDCLFCASVFNDIGGFGVHYDEKGIVVTSIYCSDKICTDALGNEVGSSLKAAIGETGNCDSGDWYSCDSPQINGLEYLVEYNEKCVFQPKPVEEKSQIPSCVKIAGFRVNNDEFYASLAD